MTNEFLFVYGTLLNKYRSNLTNVIAHCAQYIGEGYMHGRLYEVDGYPGMIPSITDDDRVIGEVYAVDFPETLFRILDQYEQCSPEYPEPHEYVRKRLPAYKDGVFFVEAWVYLYNWDVSSLNRLGNKY